MDEGQASKFVSSLVKSIQALCNGYIDFSTSIEVIGHIHLNIDRNVKLDYVLTEEVSKSISEGATVFASHSYHSQPPKSASDSSNRNRQKHKQSASVSEESDSETYRHSSSHFSDYSEPSQTGSFVDSHDRLLGKYESNRQKSCVARESPDRRRRSAPWQSHFERSSPAAAKRSRQEDSEQNFDLEVIEIKEEPDEEPTVFFGDSSSRMAAAGQDIQTPDFSNVVMESLDRVGKVEGTDLVEEGQDQMHQHQHHHQQPFPVMMHSNAPGMPSSSSASSTIPGPSLADPQGQSLASTSGSVEDIAPPPVRAESGGTDRAETDTEKSTTTATATDITTTTTTITTLPKCQQPDPSKQKHFLRRIPIEAGGKLPSPLKGAQPTMLLQPCKACREEGFGKVSAFFCPACPGQPAFCCSHDCFISYHRRMGYGLLSVPVGDARRKKSVSSTVTARSIAAAHADKPCNFQFKSFKYL